MTYSVKCLNETTFWDKGTSQCVACQKRPGHYITPNCGKDDDGGMHVVPFIKCEINTFNDGSSAFCQPCASCPSGYISSPCSADTDTLCQSSPVLPNLLWAVPLLTLFSIMLLVICACLIYRKRKLGQQTVMSYNRSSSYLNGGFSALSTPSGNYVEDILSPNILSAPLQVVLDNLDVLEELVILLDPESHGVKNTKHLASHCSFPATWITYTYSMKESKSPLKAVLEGVTCRHPDWTVKHLAKLLRQMERNDAIAVLAKLEVNVIQV